ncbi:MAG: DUF402 domain-containing protein, partial [Candidatus Bathyarchaeia archaeon]
MKAEEGMPLNVKVRGIYSTALLKLLTDSGFRVTHPSSVQMERMKLEDINEPPDIRVYDRIDLQGVIADGEEGSLEAFQNALQSSLEDAIFQFFPYSISGIYRGIILKDSERGDSILVDLGVALGKLRKKDVKDWSQTEATITVQVLRSSYLMRYPYLTTKLIIPGKYASLVKNGGVKVSRGIKKTDEVKRLLEIGNEVIRGKWGITWKSSAENKTDEVLVNDVEDLLREAEKISQSGEAPKVVRKGFNRASIEFPHSSKVKLDELRSELTPTIRNHHFYKACGGYISGAVDMAEKLLEKSHPREEVESTFKRIVSKMFPYVGSRIKIEHVKLDGRRFNLGEAEVKSVDEEFKLLRLMRSIRGRGLYNGLKTLREQGDYSITETGFGSWILKTSYFSTSGVFKGAYININTPVEVYPHSIRYVDLEVDVCLKPNGEIEVVDEEFLEKSLEERLITNFLVEKTKRKLKLILEQL